MYTALRISRERGIFIERKSILKIAQNGKIITCKPKCCTALNFIHQFISKKRIKNSEKQ